MQQQISLTVVSVATSEDTYGDVTGSDSSTTYTDCLFAPRSSSESGDTRAPAVITGAQIYRRGTGMTVRADDRVVIANVSPMIDGTWLVEGEPGYWGTAGVEFAITRGTPNA